MPDASPALFCASGHKLCGVFFIFQKRFNKLYNKESIESLENMTDGVYEKMGESVEEAKERLSRK